MAVSNRKEIDKMWAELRAQQRAHVRMAAEFAKMRETLLQVSEGMEKAMSMMNPVIAATKNVNKTLSNHGKAIKDVSQNINELWAIAATHAAATDMMRKRIIALEEMACDVDD